MINYYRDMWRRRSHVLAPLTRLTSKNVKWEFGDAERKAFAESKKILSKEAILAFPNFNKEFIIYTDASKYQLGGVIAQKDAQEQLRPLAFYSRKLNDAQTRYTTTERELLSIVETLKEFRTILLGQKLVVYTDHKNLTYTDLKTDRVLRWRLLLEEYGVTIEYVPGVHNIIADVLSRYPTTNNPEIREEPTREKMGEIFAEDQLPGEIFPLNLRVLSRFQLKDSELSKADTPYSRQTFRGGEQLLCHNGKIVVPQELRRHVVDWYHSYLMHPGETRLEETILQHLYWPNVRKLVQQVVRRCHKCQVNKKNRLKYGKLPPKDAEVVPWEHLCVDTIGPYHIRRRGKQDLKFIAVTMIDPATSWFEIQEQDDKQADTTAATVETEWLSRYPIPEYITIDGGPEFKAEFAAMIRNDYGVKVKPSSARNPQANSILERIHGVVGNMLRTIDPDIIDMEEYRPFHGILNTVRFAIRSTYHTTLKATPGQLVFGRDMIFPIQFIADWQAIKENKQALIDKNNERENAKRIAHDYRVDEKVLVRDHTANKMERPWKGPYRIVQVHTNGTVTVRKGVVTQRVNIRQVVPYNE